MQMHKLCNSLIYSHKNDYAVRYWYSNDQSMGNC